MLNLFGAIATGLGRMLPGYMQGERLANQDNWNDLNQYNKVQQGQIANAFSELTFPLAYNIYADRAGMSRMGAMNTGIDFTRRLMGLPGEFGATQVNSAWAPTLQQAQNQAALLNLQQQGQMGQLYAELAPFMLPWFRSLSALGQQPTQQAPQDPNAALRQSAGVAPTVTQ